MQTRLPVSTPFDICVTRYLIVAAPQKRALFTFHPKRRG